MNTKRIFTWGIFIVIVGLIIWGMIAAAQKSAREEAKILLPDQVTETDWIRGNPTASVTLVEYSDFQCPACAAYFPLVEKLLTERGDKMRFVYRNFPLGQHVNGIPAAQAAGAAGKQGKFWEMHDMLFTKQTDWEVSTDARTIFTGYAKEIGLDMEKFASDFDSKEIKDKITADQKSGLKAGVNATPTFYLNGKKVNPIDYEDFKKLIDSTASTTTNS